MIVNFAERAHNHNWELDPVTRSLLDTDFYKLLMLQFIWKHYPKTHVSFSLVQSDVVSAPGGYVSDRRAGRADGARRAACGFGGRNWSGWRAILSTASAESFEPAFLDVAGAGFPIVGLRALGKRRAVPSDLSTAYGPIRRCGSSMRSPSSMN